MLLGFEVRDGVIVSITLRWSIPDPLILYPFCAEMQGSGPAQGVLSCLGRFKQE